MHNTPKAIIKSMGFFSKFCWTFFVQRKIRPFLVKFQGCMILKILYINKYMFTSDVYMTCTHIRRYHSKMKRTYKYFDKMFDNKLICNILISGWQGASSTYGTSTCIKTKLVKENKNQEINLSNNCKVLLLLFVRYLQLDMSYTRHTVI